MSAILVATIVLTATSNAATSIAAAAIIGFACGPIFPWLISQTPERLGAAHGANAIGVQIASAALGLSLLPTVAGMVGDSAGVNAIPIVLIAIAVALLAGFWMLERISGSLLRRPVEG